MARSSQRRTRSASALSLCAAAPWSAPQPPRALASR
uniref:Uncharacterized protein n=1 Tax=Arundo donax TaxID=35708 RepID=A0A0A9FDZ5_ARUDO